jgi:hypothetical protein
MLPGKKVLLLALLVQAVANLSAQTVLVPYRIKNQWGYSDLNGKIKIKPQFDKAFPFDGNYASVFTGSQQGIINRSGKIIIPLIYSYLSIEKSGVRVTTKSGKVGYYHLDTKKLVVDTQYLGISPVFNRPLLTVTNEHYKYGIFDMHSKQWIAPVEYDYVHPLYDSSAVLVKRGNQKFLIPILAKGPGKIKPYVVDYGEVEELVPVKIGTQFDSVKPKVTTTLSSTVPPPHYFKSRLFKEKNKYGFIFSAASGGDSIPAMYDSIDLTKERERLLGVKNMGRWGIVNSKNEIVLPLEYPSLDIANCDIPNNLFVVLVNNKKSFKGELYTGKGWKERITYSR